jgi:hypothetical protein
MKHICDDPGVCAVISELLAWLAWLMSRGRGGKRDLMVHEKSILESERGGEHDGGIASWDG